MIKLLNQKERQILSPVFENRFDSELPDESQANIVAVVEDGEIVAFLTSEVLIRVGLLWTHPKIRKTRKSAKAIIDMARFTRESIPKGASVIAIASEDKFDGFFEKLGMRGIEGKVYRIDL